MFRSRCSQNLLELVLLCECQACRELDFDTNNEIASFVWLLTLGHTQVGVAIFVCWWCRAARADTNLLAIDGLDSSGPASECLFQSDLDVVDEVVAFALV